MHRLGVACATVGVGAFLLAQLDAWPPHEDETLALFIGREPLGDLFDTVLSERGGAPVHFLLTHLVTAVSPSLTGLRLLSALFAVASIPLVAALVTRLTDRTTSLVATVLVSASWVTLLHGVYGRMYSLFLFTSVLSFLALLRATGDNRRSSWALWGASILVTIAVHPYGALVLATQAAYILARRLRNPIPLRPAAIAFAAVVIVAIPLWRTDLVLASRFDVGVGAGGKLGGPLRVLEYLRQALGDFTAGWTGLFAVIALVALVGLVSLARARPLAATLSLSVFAVPIVALLLARLGNNTIPQTRHLIFALPFFAMLVAAGLLRTATRARGHELTVVGLGLSILVAAQVAWGWQRTPDLYAGESQDRAVARKAAESWLAVTSKPSDVLFGFEPLYLGAWEDGGPTVRTIVPRADPKLALEALLEAQKPLGRGVWVLDASDTTSWSKRLEIEHRSPGEQFDTIAFGPFLIIRTREPTVTAGTFLRDTFQVQRLGSELLILDSDINSKTARIALDRLEGRGLGAPR